MGNKLGTPAPIPVIKQHSRSKGVHIYVISTRAVANEMAVDILGQCAATPFRAEVGGTIFVLQRF